MVLVLCIGDLHIPHRVADLPAKFKSLLVPGKIQHVLCTGDLCVREAHDYLRALAPDVHVVRGQFDEPRPSRGGGGVSGGASPHQQQQHPDAKTVRVGDFTIGLIHGHQVTPWGDADALAARKRELGADVLVCGTVRRVGARALDDGGLLVTPGSATGAFGGPEPPTRGDERGGGDGDANPSFVLMDVDGGRITAYVYELVGDEVRVDKVEHGR